MPPRLKSRGYVREWLELAGLRQADLVKKLNYGKAKAFAIWHGDQRLNEDILEEVADLVHARPFELLISPEEAHKLRNLRAALRQVANEPPDDPPPPAKVVQGHKVIKLRN